MGPNDRVVMREEPAIAETLISKVTDVCMATGISRKQLADILRAVAMKAECAPPYRSKSGAPFGWWVYARVLSVWHQDPAFTDERGRPIALPFGGNGPTFRRLVSGCLPGARPTAILRSLTKLGAVRRNSKGRLLPRERSLIVKRPNDMSLTRIAHMLESLVSTMYANTVAARSLRPGTGLFERAAVSEKFDLRYLRQFDGMVRQHGQALLEQADEWLSRHEVSGRNRKRRGANVGVGIYLYARKDPLYDL